MTKVFAHGYFGWSEIQDVRTVDDWRRIAITSQLVGEFRPTTHCTPITSNMLTFEPPVGVNASRWVASDEGAAESAKALTVLLERFPLLKEPFMMTEDRIAATLRKARLAELAHA